MIKVRLQVERDNLKGDAVELTRKLEDEHSLRNDLEDELQRLRKARGRNIKINQFHEMHPAQHFWL